MTAEVPGPRVVGLEIVVVVLWESGPSASSRRFTFRVASGASGKKNDHVPTVGNARAGRWSSSELLVEGLGDDEREQRRGNGGKRDGCRRYRARKPTADTCRAWASACAEAMSNALRDSNPSRLESWTLRDLSRVTSAAKGPASYHLQHRPSVRAEMHGARPGQRQHDKRAWSDRPLSLHACASPHGASRAPWHDHAEHGIAMNTCGRWNSTARHQHPSSCKLWKDLRCGADDWLPMQLCPAAPPRRVRFPQ